MGACGRKIDWETIEVVIEAAQDPNPRNPYAEDDRAHRDQALRELARKMLLRKVKDDSAST